MEAPNPSESLVTTFKRTEPADSPGLTVGKTRCWDLAFVIASIRGAMIILYLRSHSAQQRLSTCAELSHYHFGIRFHRGYPKGLEHVKPTAKTPEVNHGLCQLLTFRIMTGTKVYCWCWHDFVNKHVVTIGSPCMPIVGFEIVACPAQNYISWCRGFRVSAAGTASPRPPFLEDMQHLQRPLPLQTCFWIKSQEIKSPVVSPNPQASTYQYSNPKW